MARGIGGIMKAAAGSVAQVPGAEDVVLAAVRDIFKELKHLRRENARLTRQLDTVVRRLGAGQGRNPARSTAARRTAS